MKPTVVLILLLALPEPFVGQSGAPVESMLREYEIRQAFGPETFALGWKYRKNLKKGGTSFHAVDTVSGLLAWGLKTDRLRIFGPAWTHQARYEVYLRTKEQTSAISSVLCQLLVEKFQLKYRRGNVAVETLVLSTPGGEPRLPSSKSAKCRTGRPPAEPNVPETGIPWAGSDAGRHQRTEFPPDGTMVFYRGCPVAGVIKDLEQHFGQHVVDETTSRGRYDFELHLRKGPRSVRHTLAPVASQLKNALGAELKLSVRPVEGALVIDSGEPVTEPLRFQASLSK